MKFIYSKMRAGSKPTGAQVAQYQIPSNYAFEEADVKRICDLVADGRAWRAGVYDDDTKDFKKASVKGAFIIALDFDCCENEPNEVIQYAETIGLKPSLWYYSYSQGTKPHNNFRVLWVMAQMITPKQYESIYQLLLEQFAQFNPDKSTKDCSRLWFGGNVEAVLIQVEPISLSTMGWLGVCEKMREGQAIKDIKKNKGLLAGEYFNEAMPEQVSIYKGWYEKLRVKCDLWDKWEKGEYLNYNQRLTLFTNIKYLKYADTSQSIIKEVLSFYKESTYAGHTCNEEQIRSMLMNRTLIPRPIVMIGYEMVSMPEFFKREQSGDEEARITKNNIPKIPLAELDMMLKEKMPELLSSKGITYICSQTACGKTEHAIRWMLTQDLENKKIIYSVPTYSLIEEFQNRFIKAYHDKMKENLSARWDSEYDLDSAFEEALPSITVPIHIIPRGNYTQDDLLLLELGLRPKTKQKKRWKAIDEMLNENSKGVFVCSHQLLSHLKNIEADIIIIDENIEEALLDVVEFTQEGLSGLLPFIKFDSRDKLIGIIDSVKEGIRGAQIDLKPLQEIVKELQWDDYINSTKKQAGIGKVFCVESARISQKKKLNTLRFTIKSTLIDDAMRKGTPIKLIGATPNLSRLSALYETDCIDKFQFPRGINEGKIIQYLGITGAKGQNCSNVENIIEFVESKLSQDVKESTYVLSFKDAVPYWRKAGYTVPSTMDEGGKITDLHLANCAGLDLLKGKNVIVAGKYDDNDDVYIDMYFDLYPNATSVPKRISQVVNVCGKSIKLFLWEDEQLRNIQLEKYRQYTEQPAGRARALREKGARVYVFSNYPIEDADEFYN